MGLQCVNSLWIWKTTSPLYSFQVRDGMELKNPDGTRPPNCARHIVSYFVNFGRRLNIQHSREQGERKVRAS
jgi:hypothetical protein